MLAGSSDVWIWIDLYQPNSKIFVYHEVVTKQLKMILSMVWVHMIFNSTESIDDDIFHSLDQVFFNFYSISIAQVKIRSRQFEIFWVQVFLKLIKA